MHQEETLSIAAARTRPLAIRLRVEKATAHPQERTLVQGECVIGAGKDADIIVEDPRISRRHVSLRLAPEGVEITDLESRNGTFYLGQKLHRAVLAPGSRIEVGGAEIRFEPDSVLLEGPLAEGIDSYHGLVGASDAMRRLGTTLIRLEGSLVNVLVLGESGVGKEVVARALHAGSNLSTQPLVVVNCAALGGDIVRSELFGHKRGAFTGAVDTRIGALERANGGTLFLDEVGELPIDVQPMLLRALETGEIQRVGDDEPRPAKARVIAATHRDLPGLIRGGDFREDLFYRLAVVTLRVAPLQERIEDIALLANHFAREAGLAELPEEVVSELQKRTWPGNARQLRNAVQAFVALGTLDEQIQLGDDALEAVLSRVVDIDRPFQEQKQRFAELFGKTYFRKLLDSCGNNRSEAARRIGMDRSYLGKLLAKHGFPPAADDDTSD